MNRPNDVLTDLPGRGVMEEELTERLGRRIRRATPRKCRRC